MIWAWVALAVLVGVGLAVGGFYAGVFYIGQRMFRDM